MPIGLPRIADGIHHEGVDVGNGEAVLLEGAANGLLSLGEQPCGPSVGNVGKKFDASVTQVGDARDGVFDGEVKVGVGGEGEVHGESGR